MEFKRQIETLHKDIQDIEKFVLLMKDSDRISLLDLDLLRTKIQQLYESLSRIKTDHQDSDQGIEFVDPDQDMEEPVQAAGIPEDTLEPEVTEPAVEPAAESAETVETPPAEPVEETITGMAQPEEKPDPEPQPARKESKTNGVLADKFRDKKQFRNEQLKDDQKLKDLTSLYDDIPITDISKAIGVNDRFQFIKELFSGESDLYKDTIHKLNNVTTIEEAEGYVQENFQWDMENKLVKRLMNLTRRKLKMNG